MKANDYLLGTIPMDAQIMFMIPKSEYFPSLKEVTKVNVCSCIAYKVDEKGDLKCRMNTKKLVIGENSRTSTYTMMVTGNKDDGAEDAYKIVIRSLITRETIKLNP